MENSDIKIEYKKFNSFLKDYIRTMSRGWLFMRIQEQYNKGDEIDFSIKVSGLQIELKAKGIVVFIGKNAQNISGTGLKFIFDKDTNTYLKKNVPLVINDKFGAVWGPKICLFMEGEK